MEQARHQPEAPKELDLSEQQKEDRFIVYGLALVTAFAVTLLFDPFRWFEGFTQEAKVGIGVGGSIIGLCLCGMPSMIWQPLRRGVVLTHSWWCRTECLRQWPRLWRRAENPVEFWFNYVIGVAAFILAIVLGMFGLVYGLRAPRSAKPPIPAASISVPAVPARQA